MKKYISSIISLFILMIIATPAFADMQMAGFVKPNSLTIEVGQTYQAEFEINEEVATELTDIFVDVQDPEVVSATDTGLITALSPGTTTVSFDCDYISAQHGLEALGYLAPNVTVTVVEKSKNSAAVEGISLSEDSLSIAPNESANINATIMPEDAKVETLAWITSDPSVVQVVDGKVVGYGEGSAKISAVVNGEFEAVCSVEVSGEPMTYSITLDPSQETIPVGGNVTINATTTPSYMADMIEWSVSPLTASKVSLDTTSGSSVTVTGLEEGSAVIFANVNEYNAFAMATITVEGTLEGQSITLSDENVTLTTLEEGQNSVEISAATVPETLADQIIWSAKPAGIISISPGSGSTVTVTAETEGEAELTATAGGISTSTNIYVDDDPITCDGIEISTQSPDYFTITAKNVRANPALSQSGEIEKVSVFCWSESDQNDINAKVAQNVNGTNDWNVTDIPVNDNAVNNYFNNADSIYINVYGSADNTTDGNIIGVAKYNWVNENSAGENLLAYIGYSANLGFDRPTVFEGPAGTTGQALPLEGLRVSSNIEGVEILTTVHAQNLGWMATAADGSYAGTMHQARSLEAVKLELTGANAENYTIEYRAHVSGLGWLEWVSGGETAGTTGQNIPMEALEIRIVPNN